MPQARNNLSPQKPCVLPHLWAKKQGVLPQKKGLYYYIFPRKEEDDTSADLLLVMDMIYGTCLLVLTTEQSTSQNCNQN